MLLFWTVAFALAWILTVPPALAQHGVIASSPIPWSFAVLVGLAPAIAAWVAARRRRERGFWKSTVRLPRPGWTALLALVLPPALLLAAWAMGSVGGAPVRIAIGADLAVFGLLWLVLAFTEEVGWRGFALPRLIERHGFWAGSLILGVAWAVWHYPRHLASPYLGSFSEAVPLLALFSLQIIFANFILCWLYLRSGRSVIAPTLFHTSFNIVATAYFLAATDLRITAMMALIVLLIGLFDNPARIGPRSPA